MNLPYTLLLGDTLERMNEIPDGSVDMVMCDLPYGTTACKWDTVIPFEPLWAQYRRIAKRNAAIVLTASQPFTTALIASNMREFRYCWVWDKVGITGGMNANKMPLKRHEDIAVFYRTLPTYNPQFGRGKPYTVKRERRQAGSVYGRTGECDGFIAANDGARHPTSILSLSNANYKVRNKVHPTQKPVALMEYLIRTYTHEGETVLDNCMGSGTTGVACANTGRQFIGIERDESYFVIAKHRIEAAYASPGQPTPPSKPKNNEKPQAATEEGFQQCSLF